MSELEKARREVLALIECESYMRRTIADAAIARLEAAAREEERAYLNQPLVQAGSAAIEDAIAAARLAERNLWAEHLSDQLARARFAGRRFQHTQDCRFDRDRCETCAHLRREEGGSK